MLSIAITAEDETMHGTIIKNPIDLKYMGVQTKS